MSSWPLLDLFFNLSFNKVFSSMLFPGYTMQKLTMIIFSMEEAKRFALITISSINWKIEERLIGIKFTSKGLLASLVKISMPILCQRFFVVWANDFIESIKRLIRFLRLARRDLTKKSTFWKLSKNLES